MKAKRGKIIMCLDMLGERSTAVSVRDTYGLFNSYVSEGRLHAFVPI